MGTPHYTKCIIFRKETDVQKYTYTRPLKEANLEFVKFGVSINAENGAVKTWWNVPPKYSAQVFESSYNEFIDFMAETGVTDVSIWIDERAGGYRVFFVVKADYRPVIAKMATVKDEWVGDAAQLSAIISSQRLALNKAANYVVKVKGMFTDYIRMCFFNDRLKHESESAPHGYEPGPNGPQPMSSSIPF